MTLTSLYDFEIDRIIETVRKNRYKTIALQFPEGLKDYATTVVDLIGTGVDCDIIISGGPSYGACDIADREMKDIGVECLFHFGHCEVLKGTVIPVEYIEARCSIDPLPLISSNLDKIEKKVGLVTTVQHVHFLKKVKEFLEGKGIEVYIGKAGGRTKYDGQVLGCNFATARSISDKVESFIYIGSGNFHPLGVSLATGKKTLAFDILSNQVRDVKEIRDRVLKQRAARISKAHEAESFGIIVGERRGQRRKELALKLKEKIRGHGKRAYIIYLKEITPDNLMPFRKLDAFVNTACPRISIDDAARYKNALLTPLELEIVLGERKWEHYEMDEIP